jgi:hypothetical protein
MVEGRLCLLNPAFAVAQHGHKRLQCMRHACHCSADPVAEFYAQEKEENKSARILVSSCEGPAQEYYRAV